MCRLCTPILALAGAGLLQGYGLASNPLMAGAVSGFATGGVRGAITGAVGAGIGSLVTAAIRDLPPCLNGVCTPAQQAAAGSILNTGTGSILTNEAFIPGTVQSQGSSLFTHLAKGATDVIQTAKTFIQQSFDIAGNFDQMKLTDSEDFGFSVRNPLDQATLGITNQFGSNETGWTQLTSNMQNNFGTGFDFSKLTETFTPTGIVKNWLNQGLTDQVLSTLDSAGFSYEMLQAGTIPDADIAKVMDTMPTKYFQEIITNIGVTAVTGAAINKFSDLLNANNLLGPAAAALVPTLPLLADKLFNLTGFNASATTGEEFGRFLAQISIPTLTQVMAAHANPAVYQALFNVPNLNLGTGSTIFGTPTMENIIGTSYNALYPNTITSMTAIAAQLSASTQGQNLIAAINAAAGTGGDPVQDAAAASAINSAKLPFTNPTNPTIISQLTAGDNAFLTLHNGLIEERKNQQLAGISTANQKGGVETVISFAQNLHDMATDTYNPWLKHETAVRSLALNHGGIYSEAILAGIAEGKNIKIFQSFGVPNPDVKLDAVQWAGIKAQSGDPPPLG